MTGDVYVVGPLCGDNFVRHLVGGSFAVARHALAHAPSQTSQ